MSFSYSRYDSQQRRSAGSQRTAFNYWIPLGVTVATAAIGLVTWAWSERRYDEYEESSSDDGHDDPYSRPPRSGQQAGYGANQQQRQGMQDTTSTSFAELTEETETLEVRNVGTTTMESQDTGTLYGRMSGAIRRTPSPQQLFDGASKRVAAGVAAAGAVVGRGLSTLKESDEDFQDHERWSAEAESRSRSAASTQQPQKRKRMIAVVVDASPKDGAGEVDPEYEIEHASLLSHLPLHIDSSIIDLLVLIYAPQLTSYPLVHTNNPGISTDPVAPSSPLMVRNPSTASSFSNISTSGLVPTPLEQDDAELSIPPPAPDPPTPTSPEATSHSNLPIAYAHLQQRALRLVPHPTNIIPFTSPTGHIHLLRSLAPSLVYIQESLCGSSEEGENVRQVEGWVGQVVVVVGGEGLGADTETEAETEDESGGKRPERVKRQGGGEWWKDDSRVGLGKTEVVDGWRFEDDWIKRVGA